MHTIQIAGLICIAINVLEKNALLFYSFSLLFRPNTDAILTAAEQFYHCIMIPRHVYQLAPGRGTLIQFGVLRF